MPSMTPKEIIEAIHALPLADQTRVREALGIAAQQTGEFNPMAMMTQMMARMGAKVCRK